MDAEKEEEEVVRSRAATSRDRSNPEKFYSHRRVTFRSRKRKRDLVFVVGGATRRRIGHKHVAQRRMNEDQTRGEQERKGDFKKLTDPTSRRASSRELRPKVSACRKNNRDEICPLSFLLWTAALPTSSL